MTEKINKKDNQMTNTFVKYEPTHLIRLEALKLAYETFHKVGGFSTQKKYLDPTTPEDFEKDIKEVLQLAQTNLKFIEGCDGTI